MGFLDDILKPKNLLKIAIGVGLFMVPGFQMMSANMALAFKSIGASLVLGAVFSQEIKPITRRQEMKAMIRSAVMPQEVLYGRPSKKGGVIPWFATSGTESEYLWHVIAVCGHEIDGYEKLWIDDKEIDIATQVDVDGFVTHPDFINADGDKLVKCKFYTGTTTQTADADLVATFGPWSTAHRGQEVAYFWVRKELDKSAGGTDPNNPAANVWANGVPRDLSVTVRGKKVYDPRLDSTNGGGGAHRLADPSTWQWSDNPILCRVDYLRSSRFGPGLADTEIDWALVRTEAAHCDALVDIPGAATQKRYVLNGMLITDDTPKNIIESMHTADHGTTVILADGAHCYTGSWAAYSHDIDESWLAGAVSLSSATEKDNAYNAVRGRYVKPDGTAVEFQPKLSSAYQTEDGGDRNWTDIDLAWTTEEYAAQRLAVIELKKSRQQKTFALQCNYRAEVVSPWETVRIYIDEAEAAGDTFRVIGKTTSQDGTITLALRQEQESDWTQTVPEFAEPPIVPDVVRDPSGVPAPSGLSAGTGPEGIRLAWTMPDMAAVSHAEVYASATNDRASATLITRTRSESFFHDLAATTVRYYWVLNRGYNNLVSAWHPVSATDGVMGTAGAAGQGPAGASGEDAIDGFVAVDGPASWVRDQDGSTWNPVATTTDIDWTFELAGVALARVSRRVTRDVAGLLTVSTVDHPATNLNTTRVTIGTTGAGSRAVTLSATYNHEGKVKTVVQGIAAALSGADGDAGLSVAELYTYRRSASAPATPTGGSYSFTTQTLTPPTGWSVGVPAGTDPVYVSVSNASITGTTGDDNTLTWSAPVKVFENGADGEAGTSAVNGVLTNEAHTVQAANNGTGYSLTGAGGTFKMWSGATDVTTSGAFAVSGTATKNGLTMTINASTGVYNLSGGVWSSDAESFTLQGTYGGVTITREYSISKSKQGLPGSEGANAPLLRLNPTSQQFKYDTTGTASPASQTITFTVVLQNLAGTATFTATLYNASGASLGTVTLGGSGNTRTLTNAQFAAAAYCTVSATLSGLSDVVTVVRTADGAGGVDGEDGQAVDMIFKRSAAQPATPSASAGVPATWYTDVNSVPAGADPLWSSVGTRPDPASNWTWQAPVKVEATDGSSGSSAMNVGRRMDRLDQWFDYTTGLPLDDWTVETVNGPIGTLGLQHIGLGANSIKSERVTFNPSKKHRVSWWAKQPSGTGTNIPFIQFYDATGAIMGAGAAPVVPSDAQNWPLVGNISHNLVNPGIAFPTSWTLYTFEFGGDAAATVPTGAVTLALCGSYAINSQTTLQLQDYHIVELANDGVAGINGYNTATLTAYKRSAAAPVDNPGTLTYTFATGGWTPLNSWSKTVPAGSNPVWAVSASALSQAATDEIAAGEWSSPVQVFTDGDAGASGLNVATVYLFRRTTTSTPPTLPSSNVTYTFSTGVATGLTQSWTQALPTTGGAYRWVTTATASATTATDTIAPGEWAAAAILAEDGAAGAPGLSHSITLADYGISCDAAGNPRAGAFDDAVGVWQVISGTTDVTASATYAIVGTSNVTAQINNSTNQNFTGAKGAYRITAIAATSGYVDMTATYDGSTVQRRFTARKVLDGAPSSYLATTTVSGLTSTQTTYIARSGPLQISVGASGTMSASFSGWYRGHNAPGAFSLVGKIQYREVGAPTWIDFGAEVTGQASAWDGEFSQRDSGWLSISQTLAAPVTQLLYEFQLLLRKTVTAGGDVTWDTSPTPPRFAVGWNL